MSIDVLLARLDGVKRTGAHRWVARCPAHKDRSPSLALTELADGFPLWHCFAGCPQLAVLSAVGLVYRDVAPEGSTSRSPRPAYNPMDILKCIANEALLVAITAKDMAADRPLPQEALDRLWEAAVRLQTAVDLGHDE